MGDKDPDRRRFLQVATCAVGGGVGIVVAAPVLRLVLDPAGRETVTSPTDPLDLGADTLLRIGEPPRRVEIIAPLVKDAWTASHNVVLGAAWLRRTGPNPGDVDARSAVCPHLGCAVGWDPDKGNYLCPCHDSRFSVTGDKLTGPSERGLDALPIKVVDGRLKLTWIRFQMGRSTSEPV